MARVFITHSSKDQDLAEIIVTSVSRTLKLANESIFCSSVDGHNIATGADFVKYIRKQLADTKLVVPLVTPAYLDSLFCMWELGGLAKSILLN